MQLLFLRQPHKFIKKANKGLKQAIKKTVETLSTNPLSGKKLQPHSSSLRRLKFSFNKNEYRIIYKTNTSEILIVLINTRENAYNNLPSVILQAPKMHQSKPPSKN